MQRIVKERIYLPNSIWLAKFCQFHLNSSIIASGCIIKNIFRPVSCAICDVTRLRFFFFFLHSPCVKCLAIQPVRHFPSSFGRAIKA